MTVKTTHLNLLLGFLLVAAMALSLTTGSMPVPVWAGLIDWLSDQPGAAALIVGDIRLPRTLLAVTVGAALGMSGAALQGLLRNPLADASLTGASQGAALGAAAVFYFGLLPAAGEIAPAIAGLLGAGLALLLMLALSGSARPSLIILAGLAISSIASAALAAVLNFAPNLYALQELVFWLLGSVENRGFAQVVLLLCALLAGGALLLSQRRLLSGLSLGEQVADSLGLDTRRGARRVVLGAAILVGASVAVAGNIGFVGLIVPHLMRPFIGHRPDRLLIPSALAGGLLVCLADIAVRLLPLSLGRELQLGVLTSILGAPLFIWLVWKERRAW